LQAKGKIAPVYQTIAEEGPPHDRRFTVAVVIDGKEISQGTGTSKKRAEQAAATAALELIQRSGV